MRKLTAHINNSTLLALLCTALLAFAGCGSPPPGGGGGGGNGNGDNGANNTDPNGDPNNDTNNATPSDTSTFEAEGEGDGYSWTGSGEIDSDEAEYEDDEDEVGFGAAIIDETLHIGLVTAGTAISADIQTSEDNPAPGTFEPGSFGQGTWVLFDDFEGGQSFESTEEGGGHIQLDSCPGEVGEMARGSFENVEMADPMDGSQFVLEGEFEVAVAFVDGELECDTQEPSNDTTTNDNNDPSNNDPQQCSWEPCESGAEGECCPYADCMAGCEMTCYMEDPDCDGGMNPEACAQCMEDCVVDDCGASDACLNSLEDLNQCEMDNGCDQQEGEEYDQCMEDHCCDELHHAL